MSEHKSTLDVLIEDGWEETGETFGINVILRKEDKMFLYNPYFQSGVILHKDEIPKREEYR